ncbi:MAG: S1 family peptidase [Gaiellales bacterium]
MKNRAVAGAEPEVLLSVSFDDGEYQLVPVDTNPIQELIVPVVWWDGHHLHCWGTAFAITATGLFVTARHVVDEFIEEYADATHAGVAGLYVLYESTRELPPLADEPDVPAGYGGLFPVVGVSQHPTADIALLRLSVPHHDGVPIVFPTLALDVGLPRKGQRCVAVGYGHMQLDGVVPPAAHRGLGPAAVEYERQLAVTRGRVLDIYPERRDSGLLAWPSFQTDARYPSGMSGSPVIADDGRVLGIVCSGTKTAPYTSAATLLASLLPMHVPPVSDPPEPTPAVAELAGDGVVSVEGWDDIDVVDTADGPRQVFTPDAVGRALL